MLVLSTTTGSSTFVSTCPSNMVAVGSKRSKATPEYETPLGPGHVFRLTVHVNISTERRGFPTAFVSTRLGSPRRSLSRHHHQHQLAVVPPSAERPQQFVEQDAASTVCRARRSATNTSSVCLRRSSNAIKRASMDKLEQTQAPLPCGMRWTREIFLSRGACHVSSQEHTVSCTRKTRERKTGT